MKRLSLLAIAALAALALTAAIGSAAASATVLCKSLKNPCPSAEVLPAGSFLTYGTSGATLEPANITLTGVAGGSITKFRCSLGIFAEKTTAESSPVGLPATGTRALDRCNQQFLHPSCTMELSSSADTMYAFTLARVIWGSTTLTADCTGGIGPMTCEWTGRPTTFITQTSEERSAVIEGKFTYVSGSNEEYCGGKEATLKTLPLYPGGNVYLVN